MLFAVGADGETQDINGGPNKAFNMEFTKQVCVCKEDNLFVLDLFASNLVLYHRISNLTVSAKQKRRKRLL